MDQRVTGYSAEVSPYRVFSRDDEVAVERELESAAYRMATHGGDDRLAAVAQCIQIVQPASQHRVDSVQPGDLGQVGADTEVGGRSRQHQAPDRVVARGVGDGGEQHAGQRR